MLRPASTLSLAMPFDPQSVSSLLVVDDDPGLRDLLCGYLRDAGFAVEAVGDGEAMRAALARRRHDLVVLDLMLPGEDGLSLCRSLRVHSTLPVIVLTARGDEFDRVLGLEMGADDYLAKPFSPRELLARIKTVLRRAHTSRMPGGTRVSFGGWTLDLAAHRLADPAGVVVPLSTGEFRLLRVLAENLDRVLSRDRLIDALAGRDASRLDRSVDVLVSRLRRRLRDDGREPRLIRTVRSEGYMLIAAPDAYA
jgi:two-component system OmpR family response regulator